MQEKLYKAEYKKKEGATEIIEKISKDEWMKYVELAI